MKKKITDPIEEEFEIPEEVEETVSLDPAQVSGAAVDEAQAIAAAVTLVKVGKKDPADVSKRLTAKVAAANETYANHASEVLIRACDEFDASQSVASGIDPDRQRVIEKMSQVFVAPAAEVYKATRKLGPARKRLSDLSLKMTGDPDGTPAIIAGASGSEKFHLWFNTYGFALVGMMFVLIVDYLVGMKAFAYFSDDFISGAITLVVIGLIYGASHVITRNHNMAQTRVEALAKRDEVYANQPASQRPKIFSLPPGLDAKTKLASRIFWGVLAFIGVGRVFAAVSQDNPDPTGIFSATLLILMFIGIHFGKRLLGGKAYPSEYEKAYKQAFENLSELEETVEMQGGSHSEDHEHGQRATEIAKEYMDAIGARRDAINVARADAPKFRARVEALWNAYNNSGAFYAAMNRNMQKAFWSEVGGTVPNDTQLDAEYLNNAPTPIPDTRVRAILASRPEAPALAAAPDIFSMREEAWAKADAIAREAAEAEDKAERLAKANSML